MEDESKRESLALPLILPSGAGASSKLAALARLAEQKQASDGVSIEVANGAGTKVALVRNYMNALVLLAQAKQPSIEISAPTAPVLEEVRHAIRELGLIQ